MNKTKASRRHLNVVKAIRKRNISKEVYGIDWYKHLHQYSKNKIHCSCGMCRFKPVWEPNAMTISDKRKMLATKQQYDEYMREVG